MIRRKSVNALNNAYEKNRWLFLVGARLHYYYETFLASHSCTFSSLFNKNVATSSNIASQNFEKINTNSSKVVINIQQHENLNLTGLEDLSGFLSSRKIFTSSNAPLQKREKINTSASKSSINLHQLKSATQQKLHSCTKAWYPKNIFSYPTQLSFAVGILLFLMSSCKKPDITFGSQFLNNSNTQVVYVDTITTEMTTVLIDSFKTSGIDGSVAGIYSDPFFGTAKAKSYLQIAPPSYEDSFSNSIFDSVELVVRLNRTYYGDTTKPLTLQVYRLAQNIKPTSGASYIFSNDSFAVYESPLAEKTFTLQPNRNDSILHIRLPDELGMEWLNMLASSADPIKSSDAFINYFKGLCITPIGSPAFVFGFADSVVVRLHYKTKSVFLTGKQVDFSLYNKDYQFENISLDRTGTSLSSISATNDEVNTSLTNNAGYLQGITGTVVKFRFPYLRSMLQASGYVQLVSAQLKVKPVNGTFTGLYPLPSSLIFSITDASNQLGGSILKDNSGNIQTGSLQIDELYGDTYYTYDITAFLKSVISISTNNEYGLIISSATPEFETTFNRVLIGDTQNKTSQTQLILYYLAVQ